MITETNVRGVQNGKKLVSLALKSTESKPTTGIMNGSTCIEVNTGKKYVYDEEGSQWTEIGNSGGGGGGGGDFSTAEVTIHFTFTETPDDMTNVTAFVPICLTDTEISAFASVPMNDIPSGSTSADFIINVPLFKNKITMGINDFSFQDEYETHYYFDYGGTPTATGNATIDNLIATITGNSTLNIPCAPML